MSDDPPFDEAAEPDGLRRFIADIEAADFVRVGPNSWEGPIHRTLIDDGHTDAERMTLIIQPSWPYLPPLLHVAGISAWHADQERLCIWHGEDASQRWVTLRGIHHRIDEWAASADRGFATVENARNPEIYWQEECEKVIGLVHLDSLVGDHPADGQHDEFHFAEAVSSDGRPSPVVVLDLERGSFRSGSRLPRWIANHREVRGRWFYRSSVSRPPTSIAELRELLTETQRERLDRDLRTRPCVMYGLVWPNNAGTVATMILSTPGDAGTRTNCLVVLRPKGRSELLLRAGPDAAILQQRSVTILGVGAIGSHVAEQLTRAGVGRLLLIDYDRIWPTNLIRHAAPPGTPAGTTKTAALEHHLTKYPWVDIESRDDVVWTPSGLREALTATDLLIEATGHAGLAELTARIASEVGQPMLSVALFRGGAVARVRRQASQDDTPVLRRRHLDRYPTIPLLDDETEFAGAEVGCLALVHNAPPVAVIRAATLAAEVAIDHLTSRNEHADEIIEVLRRGEPPFDQLGRLRADDLPITVDVTENAQANLRHRARAALPLETGGVLLGCIVDGRPVVTHVEEITDPTASTRSYRIPDGIVPEVVAAARAADTRLGYLGEWHSHSTEGGPSVTDAVTMAELAHRADATADPILLIVHPARATTDDIDAYTHLNGRLRRTDICLTGDLPTPEESVDP